MTSSSAPISASIASRASLDLVRAPRSPRRDGIAPRQQILGDGQVVAERELLMDHADAGGERVARDANRTSRPWTNSVRASGA